MAIEDVPSIEKFSHPRFKSFHSDFDPDYYIMYYQNEDVQDVPTYSRGTHNEMVFEATSQVCRLFRLLFAHFFVTIRNLQYPKYHTTLKLCENASLKIQSISVRGVFYSPIHGLVSNLRDLSHIKHGYERQTMDIGTWPCSAEVSNTLSDF